LATNPDFDFESNLANFEKEEEDEGPPTSYEKDDFFDSISCDTIDRQQGRDNRLRGSTERTLNTETFGAVALNNNNRRYNRRGRGGGRGGGRGRGRGRGGRGRGRSRYHGDGGTSQNNNNNGNNNANNSKPVAAS
jgi:protein LSM14